MRVIHSFFNSEEYNYRLINVYTSHARLGDFHSFQRCNCELVYKLDGSSDQFFPERTVRLLPDCLYIIPACCKHNDVRVDVAGSVIVAVFDLFDCPFQDELYPETLQLPQDNTYKAQFKRLLNVWERKDAGYIFRSQSVFSSVLEHIAVDRMRTYLNSNSYSRINPAIEYIDRHLTEKLQISILSELCGISDEYMRRLFRSFTGKNPLEYINSKRLSLAKELLYKSDSPIADIAHTCGFDDPRYFSRLFIREFGTTPSCIRKYIIG